MDRAIQTGISVTDVLVTPPAVRSAERISAEQEKLALRVERHIRLQTNDKIRELRIEIHRTGVLLHGRCGTFYCKQVAQQAAMNLIGDRPLINQIEVW
jgi:osmotically-inducible protein OsmY